MKSTEKRRVMISTLEILEQIKFDPKWLNVAPVTTRTNVTPVTVRTNSISGSKKSRAESSHDVSDAHINIDLNAGLDTFPDAEVPSPQTHPPMGRVR